MKSRPGNQVCYFLDFSFRNMHRLVSMRTVCMEAHIQIAWRRILQHWLDVHVVQNWLRSARWGDRVIFYDGCRHVDFGSFICQGEEKYHQISNIKCTKSWNLNVSCLVLQLSLCSLLKPGVKSVLTKSFPGSSVGVQRYTTYCETAVQDTYCDMKKIFKIRIVTIYYTLSYFNIW